MIRFNLGEDGRFESASSAADLLRKIADKLDDGETSGTEWDDMHEGVTYEVEELCEFCDGEGVIESDNGNLAKCFNCNAPDYDAMREGK